MEKNRKKEDIDQIAGMMENPIDDNVPPLLSSPKSHQLSDKNVSQQARLSSDYKDLLKKSRISALFSSRPVALDGMPSPPGEDDNQLPESSRRFSIQPRKRFRVAKTIPLGGNSSKLISIYDLIETEVLKTEEYNPKKATNIPFKTAPYIWYLLNGKFSFHSLIILL